MSNFKEKASEINMMINAMYIAMKRSDTPLYAKIAGGLCVWYALSPLDLVPDFIPVLGAVDDVLVLPFLLWLSVKLMPVDILEECKAEAKAVDLTDKRAKKRYMIPVLAIWTLLLFWAYNLVVKYTTT